MRKKDNTANDRMIILTYWDLGNQEGDLVYFGLSAEESLEKMYSELAGDEVGDPPADNAPAETVMSFGKLRQENKVA